jgi:hypothetical protein
MNRPPLRTVNPRVEVDASTVCAHTWPKLLQRLRDGLLMRGTMLYDADVTALAPTFPPGLRQTDVASSTDALRRSFGTGERSAHGGRRLPGGMSHTDRFRVEQRAMCYLRDRRFEQP